MAARKTAPKTVPPFAEPDGVRTFAHPDGRTYDLQLVDCRVYESWTQAAGGGGNNVSTRDSDEDALSFAWSKAKSLLKKGFAEGPPGAGRLVDNGANVIDVIRANLNHAGEPRENYQPLGPHVHACATGLAARWLVGNDAGTRAILLVCAGVARSKQPAAEREAIANVCLDVLLAHRAALFGDERTPVRKLPLPTGAGRFTHLVVLSPAVENYQVDGRFTLSRSVFRAFPAFDCEMSETDSVTVAEARIKGHGSMSYAAWDREPHPVIDLAHLKDANESPKYLVYPPAQLALRTVQALAKGNLAEIRARNFRGEVRRLAAGEVPDLGELRGFFGFVPGPA